MRQLWYLLLGIATGSTVVEFLSLRLLLRLGAVLPDQATLLPLYRLIEAVGLFTLNLATLAAAGLLAVGAIRVDWRRPTGALTGLLLLVAVLVSASLSTLLAVLPTATAVMVVVVAASAAAIAIAGGAWRQAAGRPVLVLVALAQLAALYDVLGAAAVGQVLDLPGAGWAAFVAEGLAVLTALVLPWAIGCRPTRHEVAVGVGLAALFLVAVMARPWTIATMTMWMLGFSLSLPGPLYALALGSLVVGLLALRRAMPGTGAALGLLLIVLAGLKLDFTYNIALSLAGLLALRDSAAAWSRDDEPRLVLVPTPART